MKYQFHGLPVVRMLANVYSIHSQLPLVTRSRHGHVAKVADLEVKSTKKTKHTLSFRYQGTGLNQPVRGNIFFKSVSKLRRPEQDFVI
jgi:hypothetical protein